MAYMQLSHATDAAIMPHAAATARDRARFRPRKCRVDRIMGAKATQAKGQPRRIAMPASRGTCEKSSVRARAVHSNSSVAAVVVGSKDIWWLNRPGEVARKATAR